VGGYDERFEWPLMRERCRGFSRMRSYTSQRTSCFTAWMLTKPPLSLRSPRHLLVFRADLLTYRPLLTGFIFAPSPSWFHPRSPCLSFPPMHTIAQFHHKYPNPYATHVHTVDTISRTIDPETGIIRSERVIGVQQGAPRWITKVSDNQ